MKKVLIVLGVIIISLSAFALSFKSRVKAAPKEYYKVYLDGEVIGIINSKEKLEKYINEKNQDYKEKFGVDTVYSPNGLDIEKILTYVGKVDSIEDIYEEICDKNPFTIQGYQFTITKTVNQEQENSETIEVQETTKLYTTTKQIFEEAVKNIIKTYVGEDQYNAYLNGTQPQITTTGTYIDNIYLNDDITIKEVKIPVDETIYTTPNDLTKYLLFGTTEEQKKYVVKAGDNIEDVAYNNKISVLEFLISNPTFSSSSSLLFPGQEVLIGITAPQINVVVESSVVEDKVKQYSTVVQYDETMQQGYNKVLQVGVDGLERVSQKVKTVNGNITYIDPKGSTEIKTATSQIIVYGSKLVPNVGITSSWLWPTRSGYTLSSRYGYRTNPFTGGREFHTGLDISGTGYGSPIYASNNGTVIVSDFHYSYGNYIVINHNNGYYTLYAHMSKRLVSVGTVVSRGQTIGLVGATGSATGPHLHFEVWKNGPPFSGSRLNPLSLTYYH